MIRWLLISDKYLQVGWQHLMTNLHWQVQENFKLKPSTKLKTNHRKLLICYKSPEDLTGKKWFEMIGPYFVKTTIFFITMRSVMTTRVIVADNILYILRSMSVNTQQYTVKSQNYRNIGLCYAFDCRRIFRRISKLIYGVKYEST